MVVLSKFDFVSWENEKNRGWDLVTTYTTRLSILAKPNWFTEWVKHYELGGIISMLRYI